METEIPIRTILLFGKLPFDITYSLVTQWVVMAIIIIILIVLSKRLYKIPKCGQSAAEIFYESISKVIVNNLGEEYIGFVSFFGTMAIYILFMNLTGLFGIKPPTADYNVALGLALISFLVIQFYAIKRVGVKGYFAGYVKPLWVLTPINIMERFVFPVSLSLRLFGNMLAASIIVDLSYSALGKLSWFMEMGIPVILHTYFDLFDGVLQMVIFVMLSMINLKIIAEH
ncbi:ATP synthase subunit a [Clostridium tepidiprofundi DSM 19306]|uniref:ATP synthase subunit a n=1 Tax=Clostridium tepidiprofundi DSM 19306 TaxID=1121338 RepID=A0A151B4T1_9CLOT|nr:F0F1 ATP synthase subunit A [Clostridium tepidiprofundi]KYH34915.1 ATP synthase subunit a [Clostridium tepidiprofundi DSM 19306]